MTAKESISSLEKQKRHFVLTSSIFASSIRSLIIASALLALSPVARAQTESPPKAPANATGLPGPELDLSVPAEIAGPPAPPANSEVTEVSAPVADPKVLDESGLSNPVLNQSRGRYSKPLLFAPEDNGIEFGRAQLKWQLENGNAISLSGLRILSSQIALSLTQVFKRNSGLFSKSSGGKIQTILSFHWPEILSKTGTLSFETEHGDQIWTHEIKREEHDRWVRLVKGNRSFETGVTQVHRGTGWGVIELNQQNYPFLYKQNYLRACLTSTTPKNESLRICTGMYAFVPGAGGRLGMRPSATAKAPTVSLDGKAVSPRGLVNFPDGKKITLAVEFTDGAFFEIVSQPIHLHIYDVVQSPSGQTLVITGEGSIPVGRVKFLKKPETHFWSGTIVKEEQIWQIAVPKEASLVKVLGAFNMPFILLINSEKFPKEKDRAYLYDNQEGTYSRRPLLYGLLDPSVEITSDQAEAKKTDPNHFEWKFAADKQSEENRSLVKIKDESGETWTAHFEMYRAPASEVSAHFTGVLSSGGQAIAMAEANASHWFEDLWITRNRVLALQRWGVNVRYFKAFSTFTLGDGSVINEFSTLSGDLKYTLVHGLRNRDELFGLMLSGERITFSTLHASLLGGGAFWARTMPKIFDDLFNYVEFLQYPKYLEVELIYDPLSVTPGVKGGLTYNLNFRGKVFFKPTFFGEAGFGIKQFSFTDKNQTATAAFTTAYGLIGVGLLF
jgi:hypothetical protein